jgi:hypothetical protein
MRENNVLQFLLGSLEMIKSTKVRIVYVPESLLIEFAPIVRKSNCVHIV